MTLVLSVSTKHAIWTMADRRLTGPSGPSAGLATKILRSETSNSKGLISYCGIGSKNDIEVSDWIKRALRGPSLNYVESINRICSAANIRIPGSVHAFIANSFVDGVPHQTTVSSRMGKKILFDVSEKVIVDGSEHFSVHDVTFLTDVMVSVYGSGAAFFREEHYDLITRTAESSLRRYGKDFWHNSVNNVHAVLAKVCREISRADPQVSPECISACFLSDGTSWARGYDRFANMSDKIAIPSVSDGWPINELVCAILPTVSKSMIALEDGREIDREKEKTEINAALARLFMNPNDRF
ncbi:hypothetical protein [Amaricoccus sp. W119]|uniref:hypothetical protein n=1 Tax=Amaricoccus sp. W119 TaxID=3391833 RepID=UPI0039A55859